MLHALTSLFAPFPSLYGYADHSFMGVGSVEEAPERAFSGADENKGNKRLKLSFLESPNV